MVNAKDYTQWECQECLILYTTEEEAESCCKEKDTKVAGDKQ